MRRKTSTSSETSTESEPAVAKTIPDDILRLLGHPPVLRSENIADYQALLGRLANEMDPRDTGEWMLLRDMADSLWDHQRMQRIRTALIDKTFPDVACRLIKSIYGAEEAIKKKNPKWSIEGLVAGMLNGEKSSADVIDYVLSWQGYTRDTIMVGVMEKIGEQVAEFDRLIDDAQRRHRSVVRDFERYRLAWTQQRRHLPSPVTDLDPAEVVA